MSVLNPNFSAVCYNLFMFGKFKAVVTVVSLVFLLAMMWTTTPSGVGPLGVLVFFTLCYIVSFGVMSTICRCFFVLKSKMDKRHLGGEDKKSFYYGAVLAFAPVLLLGMQAFGGVGWLELLFVILAMVLACFLVAKKIL